MKYNIALLVFGLTLILLYFYTKRSHMSNNQNSNKCLHVDYHTSPVADGCNWFTVRSYHQWCEFVKEHGVPNEIHFGPNQGVHRELANTIVTDLIAQDTWNGFRSIPDNFSYTVNSSLRLHGDKFYNRLNNYLCERLMAA